ncbi:MAG: hypothetical protein ABL891_09325 [Burkholderiales bacterium]
MRPSRLGFVLAVWACAAGAQSLPAKTGAPVQDRSVAGNAALQHQQRTSAAYRALEQARQQRKFAEQDYVNTDDAYRAAQQRADDMKRELEKMAKARETAIAKETAAAKAYEAALNAGGAR